MTSNSLPEGFIPVMLTPFLADGQVDYEGLELLTDKYIQWGAKGLFANCLSSEMYELSSQERLDVVNTVVHTAAGRVPVVATGTLGGTLEEMAEFSKRLWRMGVSAVIVLNNILTLESESDAVFLDRMHAFMKLTPGIPLGIYECPVPYKRLITVEILENLLPTGRLVYHKDTSLDIQQVRDRVKAGANDNFGLYDAYMGHAVLSLQAGAKGLSCIQGNLFPELIVWLCAHARDASKKAIVDEVQAFFANNMDPMHAVYPTAAKYVLQKNGFPMDLYTRREVGTLTAEHKVELDRLIAEGQALWVKTQQ